MEQLKFNVEEYHRGEWQPFMVKDKDGNKVQRYAKITQEQADWNNKQKDVYKLRYVLDGAKKEEKNEGGDEDKNVQDPKLVAEFCELTGKSKVYHAWTNEQIQAKIDEEKSK